MIYSLNGVGTWALPNLTYSFVNPGGIQFDAAYTRDLDALGPVLPTLSPPTRILTFRHMMEFTSDEKTFIRDTLDWFSDYSGIQFNEVSDSTSTYGDLRFIFKTSMHGLDLMLPPMVLVGLSCLWRSIMGL